MTNDIFFSILLFFILADSTCKAQEIDTAFIKAFCKNYSPKIGDTTYLKTNEIIYFEVKKKKDKFVLSALKGVHSKLFYETIYEAFERIDAAPFDSNNLNAILIHFDFNESDEYRENVIKDFKMKYGIEENVTIITSNYMKKPIR